MMPRGGSLSDSCSLQKFRSEGNCFSESYGVKELTGSDFLDPFMPTVAFSICCPRDYVSRHNGGNAVSPLKPLRDDSVLRALSSKSTKGDDLELLCYGESLSLLMLCQCRQPARRCDWLCFH